MTTVIVVLSRPLSNYCYMPSLKQLLFYVVPQSSDKQSLILGVLPPGLSINSKPLVIILVCVYVRMSAHISIWLFALLGTFRRHRKLSTILVCVYVRMSACISIWLYIFVVTEKCPLFLYVRSYWYNSCVRIFQICRITVVNSKPQAIILVCAMPARIYIILWA